MTNVTKTSKTIQGITYTARMCERNGKYVGTNFEHETENGYRAVAWNATRILGMLNSKFAKEIAEFKAGL